MEKAKEFNTPIYMAFIDYSKAFDSVRHSLLWKILRRMGVCTSIIRLMKSLYAEQLAAVKVEKETSEWFKFGKGTRQGCLASPMLFNFYSEEIMRRSVDELNWIGINISGKNINNLRYADDIVLISTSKEGLQDLINEVERVSAELLLEINTKKTKVMAMTREPEVLDIRCRNTRLEQVLHFKYLGAMVEHTAGVTKEIKARLGAARSALGSLDSFWGHRSISNSTKLKLVKTLVWPIALYGCESWTLLKADTARLHVFEMRCYRRMLKVSWREHRTNESILEELRTSRQLVSAVKKRKLQYFGHITRAQNLSTHLLDGRLHGQRPRGRPKRRWLDDVKEWTSRSIVACTAAARDRRAWRRMVHTAVIPDPQP